MNASGGGSSGAPGGESSLGERCRSLVSVEEMSLDMANWRGGGEDVLMVAYPGVNVERTISSVLSPTSVSSLRYLIASGDGWSSSI